MSAYDFDIENYSDEDLVSFLKLPKNFTKDLVVSHIDAIIEKYKIKTPKTDTERNFANFLKLSKSKLLNYLKRREPVQVAPTNFDILQSQSLVIEENHAATAQKIIPVVNTNEYKFPVGVINPVEKRVTTKIFNIDTVFRDNYSNTNASNFTWNLSNPLTNVMSMNIVSLELPNVWYTISSKNSTNAFQITVSNIIVNKVVQAPMVNVITIPDGNYSSTDFANNINNYFLNVKNGLDFLVVVIDPITTKTTIRARDKTDAISSPAPYNVADSRYSPNFSFTVEFLNYGGQQMNCSTSQPFNPLQKTLGWFMGFRNQRYTITNANVFVNNTVSNSQSITYGGFLQSESSYGSSLHNYLFIEVDDFNRNFITDSIVSVTNDAYIGKNILGKIPISSSPNNMIFNNPSDCIFKMREYLGPVNIKRLNVRLLNKFGEVIDLNTNDFSMTLEFKILY